MSCQYNWRAFTPTHEAAIPEAGRWSLGVTQAVNWMFPPHALPVRAAVKRGQRIEWDGHHFRAGIWRL
jgi:hypothetical protein